MVLKIALKIIIKIALKKIFKRILFYKKKKLIYFIKTEIQKKNLSIKTSVTNIFQNSLLFFLSFKKIYNISISLF